MRPPPPWRRLLARLAQRAGLVFDMTRTWNRADLESPEEGEIPIEAQIATHLRARWTAVCLGILTFFLAGIATLWGAGPALAEGVPGFGWIVPLLAGVLAHGLFVLLVHEATHANLLGKSWDRSLGNVALGCLFLPFLAELYQEAHAVHHGHVNRAADNNWTRYRHALFSTSRWLYLIYELVPVINNLDRVRQRAHRRPIQLTLAWLAGAATWLVFQPPITYVVLVIVGMNVVNALRLWGEHFGHFHGQMANTYRCPLGFGIGHHDLHHRSPKIPALALMFGLWFRRADHHIAQTPWKMLTDPSWRHFRVQQADFDGTVR